MPKKTTEAIIESNNDYVIGVKTNQPTLYYEIKSIIADKTKYSSHYTTLETNKGRQELRSVTVSNCIEGISKDWVGVRQIIGVHREVINKGKKSVETAYFISSRDGNALLYNEGIRGHWEVENSLHWVKDVTFKEDASKIKKGDAPATISTLKNIAINIFRENGYKSIAVAIRLVSNDIDKLCKLTI